MGSTLWIGLLGVVVLLNGLTDARKYGRNCGDIGCLTTEKCVLLEDPCTIGSRGECGSYPSCVKIQQGCEKINCHRGEYCINENGQSRCVPNSYDPNEQGSKDRPSVNPHSNANAPPPELPASHPGYPTDSHYGAPGQKPSQTVDNLGYPTYPPRNRLPQAGNYQPGNVPPNSGYPPYQNNQQPYPYNPYSNNPHNKKYHGSATSLSFTSSLGVSIFGLHLILQYLS